LATAGVSGSKTHIRQRAAVAIPQRKFPCPAYLGANAYSDEIASSKNALMDLRKTRENGCVALM
jgi:hypothetical protein